MMLAKALKRDQKRPATILLLNSSSDSEIDRQIEAEEQLKAEQLKQRMQARRRHMAELRKHVVAHLETTFDTLQICDLTPQDASNVD